MISRTVLIRAGAVVLHSKRVARNVLLEIRDGRVARVQPYRNGYADWDFGEFVLIPGLVNAHTHLELSAIEVPRPPATQIASWIDSLIQKRNEQNPRNVQRAAQQGVDLCLNSGTTLIGEIESQGESADRLNRSRLRATVYREFLGLDPKKAKSSWMAARTAVMRKQSEHVRFGVSPHAPFSLSRELMHEFSSHFRSARYPMAIHLAESPGEMDFLTEGRGEIFRWLSSTGRLPKGWSVPGRRPLEWLSSFGVLNARCLLVHGNYLNAAEIKLVAQKKVSVVFCPGSHEFFRHRKYPLDDYLRFKVNLALGTDSLASNESLSMFREMRLLRESFRDLAASTVLQMATENGARALGWGNECGSLVPGKQADFVALRMQPEKSDRKLLDQITSTEPSVEATFVAGEPSGCYKGSLNYE